MEYTYIDGVVMETKEGARFLIPDQVSENPYSFKDKVFEVINEDCDSVDAMFGVSSKELVIL